ncbi:MAG: DUF2948 family protein [Pseudomonadota bacterium]|nr:DUF2948 family protein [Pseudomonadota bacterium]|tara:strand:+ start:338 stop:769 length:432 start_codon:yes stop_codon:yes gene_type:complete
MTEEAEYSPIKLRACSLEDLSLISALLQDAIVPIGDIAFLKDEKSFVLVASRYCWEYDNKGSGLRVLSGLRFDCVKRAVSREIDRRDRNQFLELLSINYSDGFVAIHFSRGGAVRLEVERLNVAVQDLSEPHPTTFQPRHSEN